MAPSTRLIDRDSGAPLFHRNTGVVTGSVFLADAATLAARLPDGQFIANLCRDRYAFAVAFAAGLLCGRTALLNVDAAALPGLATQFPGLSVLSDMPVMCTLPATQVADLPRGGAAPNPAIPDDHLAAIVFTSGSTGTPVGHEKRWGALAARTRAAATHFGLRSGTVVGTVPPQHMYGFETTVLLPMHAPVASWCGPAFFPADVAAALHVSAGPRTVVTIPLQLRALLTAVPSLSGLAAVISATAPLDPALAAAAEQAWEVPVLEIFGATECGSIAGRRTTAGPDWSPYPGVRLRLDEAGAVAHAIGAAPVPLADVLEATPAGFRLLGRRTDLVKLGGRRASLLGLNQVLTGLDGVDDGAFVVPDDLDERSTARLLAVVVAPERSPGSILAELRRVLDPIFLPRRVIRVERMPRNDLGKLPRSALLQLVAGAGA